MNLTIGRINLNQVAARNDSANRVRITGRIPTTEADDAQILRDQLLGLVDNPDERFVPVTSSTDPHLNGFYTVASVTVDVGAGGLELGWWPYTVDLAPLPTAHRQPGFRSNSVGTTKPNGYDITSSEPWVAVPGHSIGFTWGDVALRNQHTRVCEGGTVEWAEANIHTGVARFSVEPEWWYEGGCAVEALTSTSPDVWTPVVGRNTQLLAGNTVRVTNGLVRVTVLPSTDGTNPGQLLVQWWSPDLDDWTTGYLFRLRRDALTWSTNWDRAEIMRNDPAQVSVRFLSDDNDRSLLTYLTLRRGSRWVYGQQWTDGLDAYRLAVNPTGALPFPTADSEDFIGYFASGTDPLGGSPTDDYIEPDALVGSWDWGIGGWFDGESDHLGGDDVNLRQYLSDQAETVVATGLG